MFEKIEELNKKTAELDKQHQDDELKLQDMELHYDEHGPARLLTDDECDTLVPSYTFLNDMEEKKR